MSWKSAAGRRVDRLQRLTGAVERREPRQRPALVGDGDQRRPLRSAGAGAADADPTVIGTERVVHGHADAGVISDIRHLAAGEFGAHAAAAAPSLPAAGRRDPGRFAANRAAGGEIQIGPADGQDIRRSRREFRDARITRRSDKGDPLDAQPASPNTCWRAIDRSRRRRRCRRSPNSSKSPTRPPARAHS